MAAKRGGYHPRQTISDKWIDFCDQAVADISPDEACDIIYNVFAATDKDYKKKRLAKESAISPNIVSLENQESLAITDCTTGPKAFGEKMKRLFTFMALVLLATSTLLSQVAPTVQANNNITPVMAVTHIAGSGTVNSIDVPKQCIAAGCSYTLITDAVVQFGTSGNISFGFTSTAGTAYQFRYDPNFKQWFPPQNLASAQAASSSGSGSTRVIYTSQIQSSGTAIGFGDANVAPGSSSAGSTDRAAAINTAISSGNVFVIVDGKYGLSTSLVAPSNTRFLCSPGMGFIMKAAANLPVMVNAHPQSPTSAGSTPSNFGDSNISVDSCILNANSQESVTGTDPIYSNPHHVSAITGKWVPGLQFAGVQNLSILNSNIYDTAAYGIAISNIQFATFNGNYIHQLMPTSTTFQNINTDGIHCTGPCRDLYINDNHINAGDDSIALNADDGNRSGSNDPNGPYVNWTGFTYGQITDVFGKGNTFDSSAGGYRLFTSTSLIDRIQFENTSGSVLGVAFQADNYSNLGAGNLGSAFFNGFDVQSNGTTFPAGYAHVLMTVNYKNLHFSNFHLDNPSITTQPIFLQSAGAGGTLAIDNADLDTTTSAPSAMIALTGGSLYNLRINGLTWKDASSLQLISGTVYPTYLTVSNYAGPNKLLASGYTPTVKNGDAFANAGAQNATYVSTTFTEGAANASLNGTAPATTPTGKTWVENVPGSWKYETGGVQQLGTTGYPLYATIDSGQANYVYRATVTSDVADIQLIFRFTDINNYCLLNMVSGQLTIYDVTAGSATAVATYPGPTTSNYNSTDYKTGSFTITVNGTAVAATGGGASISGTLPNGSANTTSGKVGMLMYANGGVGQLSSLSVSSN